jgi:hypothetical protein
VDVEAMSVAELLGGYARILAELRRRGVVRTNNAPVGDYAELLVAAALGGDLAASVSEKSYDLITPRWGKVQVKARAVRVPVSASHAQTSPFRSWDFDYAALVMVHIDDYSIHRAVLVPVELVRAHAPWRKSVNGCVAYMRGPLLDDPSVVDITAKVADAASTLT